MFKKPSILTQIRFVHSVDLPRLRLRSPAVMALVSLPLLVALTAFALVSPSTLDTPPPQNQVQALPLTVTDDGTDNSEFTHSERVARGDSLGSLLDRLGVDDDAAMTFMQHNTLARSITSLNPGSVIHARLFGDGRLLQLAFRHGDNQEVLINRTSQGFVAQNQPLYTGVVDGSLFAAFDQAGIPDIYSHQVLDIFAANIDFHHGIQRGDSFSVAYEVAVDRYGSPVRYGRLLAAEFTNGGQRYQAVAFNHNGETEYYTPDGHSLKRAFLQNPVEFSRITSGFSLGRLHPLLNDVRPHKGVDFAAPIGSKVMATGAGVVDFIGVQSGFGKVVILHHDGDYSTVYGHLSAFANGLRKGSSVSQGQVIAYVGMSGLATGPHLHYEFHIHGQAVDPMSAAVPVTHPLPTSERLAFQREEQRLQQQLAMSVTQSGNATFE